MTKENEKNYRETLKFNIGSFLGGAAHLGEYIKNNATLHDIIGEAFTQGERGQNIEGWLRRTLGLLIYQAEEEASLESLDVKIIMRDADDKAFDAVVSPLMQMRCREFISWFDEILQGYSDEHEEKTGEPIDFQDSLHINTSVSATPSCLNIMLISKEEKTESVFRKEGSSAAEFQYDANRRFQETLVVLIREKGEYQLRRSSIVGDTKVFSSTEEAFGFHQALEGFEEAVQVLTSKGSSYADFEEFIGKYTNTITLEHAYQLVGELPFYVRLSFNAVLEQPEG